MLYIALVISSYFLMEFVAWSNHKYVMHGFLWKWHMDHHIHDQQKIALKELKYSGFEKNDLFFLVYAIPAILLVIVGLSADLKSLIFIGAGITLYGFTYFFIHDIIIHQRIMFLQNPKNSYINAIIKAHLAHHRPKNVKDFSNFGLLIFPRRFFKK